MLLTAFESAMIHTLCTPPPPTPQKLLHTLLLERGGEGGGAKRLYSKVEGFFEILSYGFMLCCQIMYEAQCTC